MESQGKSQFLSLNFQEYVYYFISTEFAWTFRHTFCKKRYEEAPMLLVSMTWLWNIKMI